MQSKSRSLFTGFFSILLLVGVSLPVLANRLYRVQPGDTVYLIAQWHGISAERLAEANQLAQPGFIIPRQVLLIPDPITLVDEELYTVKAGDSLMRIARAFRTDLNWLRARNQLSSDLIYVGQRLKVPAPPAKPSEPKSPGGSNGNSQYVWNIPDLMARHPGKVFLQGRSDSKQVALTFDDGPDTEYTTRILDTLGRLGVKATFFLQGKKIPGREWVVSRIVKEGHTVANHSYSHPNLRKMSPEQIINEVQRTEELIAGITSKRTALLRPPYGEMSEEGLDRLVARGYQMINWSVDSGDWQAENADQVLVNTLPQIKPGSILLMHSAGGEGQDLTPSVEALEELIITLQGRGYKIVPLTELLPVQAYK